MAFENNSLLNTTVKVDPVAVVYNLESSDIENFVLNYLRNEQGIDGVSAVRIRVRREGTQRPEAGLYVFLDMESSDVFTNLNRVASHLRNKIDVGGFRASDKLYEAVKPIVNEFKINSHARNGVLYIRLNLFRTLGLMLGVQPSKHLLTISEIAKVKKKNYIFSIIKSIRIDNKTYTGDQDRFANILDEIED